MTEEQKQINFQKDFLQMAASESNRPFSSCGTAATAYEALASEACLIPTKWEALPWEFQLAFERASKLAYNKGFEDGIKFAAAIKK